VTVLVIGSHVSFQLLDKNGEPGRYVHAPAYNGLVHDRDGTKLPRCDVFVVNYKVKVRHLTPSADARAYFGPTYPLAGVELAPIPNGGWKYIGRVSEIRYTRPARRPGDDRYKQAKAAAPFFHPFNKPKLIDRLNRKSQLRLHFEKPCDLYKSGSVYRLVTPNGCVINERGFVTP
jgi:hypothetical protein